MDRKEEFGEGLKRLINSGRKAGVWPGKVISVDDVQGTCDVEDMEGLERFDVRLRATIESSSTGLIIIPKVGSFVLVAEIGGSGVDSCVVQYSEVEKVSMNIGTRKMVMDNTGLEISNGAVNLNTVLGSLIEQIKLITVPCTAPGSPSGLPINAAAFVPIKTQLAQLLK